MDVKPFDSFENLKKIIPFSKTTQLIFTTLSTRKHITGTFTSFLNLCNENVFVDAYNEFKSILPHAINEEMRVQIKSVLKLMLYMIHLKFVVIFFFRSEEAVESKAKKALNICLKFFARHRLTSEWKQHKILMENIQVFMKNLSLPYAIKFSLGIPYYVYDQALSVGVTTADEFHKFCNFLGGKILLNVNYFYFRLKVLQFLKGNVSLE